MTLKYASIPETITILECCVCFENIKPEEAYKFWECDQHYTCRQCGTSLKTCPLCRSPSSSYVSRPCTPSAKKKIREDWKEEAIRKGLLQTCISNIDDNNSVIIQSWTSEGRCLTSKREAAKLNIEDVRLSW